MLPRELTFGYPREKSLINESAEPSRGPKRSPRPRYDAAASSPSHAESERGIESTSLIV